jgi:hypothetical protein
MSLLGWLTILCGSSSHLSAILCFPSKATILISKDENSEKPNEINPAPKWQRLRKPRKKPTKPDNNEDTVELESDDESEQEYYVIYRPDEVPQNNTHSDAHHVDSDQAVPLWSSHW